MTTYIELCRKVARESGTISGFTPSSVLGQTGRPAKVVYWVGDAWREIQTLHDTWLWMRRPFTTGPSTMSTARYTAASFGIDRWADWDRTPGATTIYKQSLGLGDQHVIPYLDFPDFERLYLRGTQSEDYPSAWTVDRLGQFVLGAVPDGAYIINGIYRAGPQELAVDGDVPEMPSQYHDVIAHRALLLLAEHDEGQFHTAVAMRRYRELMDALERNQLPWITTGRFGCRALA